MNRLTILFSWRCFHVWIYIIKQDILIYIVNSQPNGWTDCAETHGSYRLNFFSTFKKNFQNLNIIYISFPCNKVIFIFPCSIKKKLPTLKTKQYKIFLGTKIQMKGTVWVMLSDPPCQIHQGTLETSILFQVRIIY